MIIQDIRKTLLEALQRGDDAHAFAYIITLLHASYAMLLKLQDTPAGIVDRIHSYAEALLITQPSPDLQHVLEIYGDHWSMHGDPPTYRQMTAAIAFELNRHLPSLYQVFLQWNNRPEAIHEPLFVELKALLTMLIGLRDDIRAVLSNRAGE